MVHLSRDVHEEVDEDFVLVEGLDLGMMQAEQENM